MAQEEVCVYLVPNEMDPTGVRNHGYALCNTFKRKLANLFHHLINILSCPYRPPQLLSALLLLLFPFECMSSTQAAPPSSAICRSWMGTLG